jgi:hypothetical protein
VIDVNGGIFDQNSGGYGHDEGVATDEIELDGEDTVEQFTIGAGLDRPRLPGGGKLHAYLKEVRIRRVVRQVG